MLRLAVKCWLLLLFIDIVLTLRGFPALHRMVRNMPARRQHSDMIAYDRLCRAVDIACVFYFRRVLCLARSTVTTILLRSHGWNAEMVIGVQILPFKSHAWCEVNGLVVNDRPYVNEIYSVLERC